MKREEFAAAYPFALDDFQVRALDALDAGESVLVAAPTGSGKTVVVQPDRGGARPWRPLHGAGQGPADELGLGQPLVGRAAGERFVEIRLEIDARLLHPT